jgi:hypothetical protein
MTRLFSPDINKRSSINIELLNINYRQDSGTLLIAPNYRNGAVYSGSVWERRIRSDMAMACDDIWSFTAVRNRKAL